MALISFAVWVGNGYVEASNKFKSDTNFKLSEHEARIVRGEAQWQETQRWFSTVDNRLRQITDILQKRR